MTTTTTMTQPRRVRVSAVRPKCRYPQIAMITVTDPFVSQNLSVRHHAITPSVTACMTGLPLLPEDYRFIQQRLARLPSDRCVDLLQGYRHVWQRTQEAEPQALWRDNQARRAANLWLLRQTT